MNRREFIRVLGGAAAWPMAARAQTADRMRRVGVLMGLAESDPITVQNLQALRGALQARGWIEGQNLQLVYRYAAGDSEQARARAKELVELQPDVILAHSTPVAAAFKQATRTIPIVFVSIADPVNNGFITSFARPGSNMTGFTNYEFAMGGKWLEILKEIAPSITRVSLMLSPDTGSYYAEYMRSVEAVALTRSVQATLAPVRTTEDIDRLLTALAREVAGGVIVLPSVTITANRGQIIALAARHRLPVIYPFPYFAAEGGLVSYGVDLDDLFRRAAGYLDRILKGAQASELPVQAPVKFQLVANMRAAKEIGITIPESVLARADEVIE